jgi:hypothetical protein
MSIVLSDLQKPNFKALFSCGWLPLWLDRKIEGDKKLGL